MKTRVTSVAPTLFAALLALCSARTASAQPSVSQQPLQSQQSQDTFPLGRITATATKLPAPVAATNAAVTVITGAELRERGVRRVLDALRTVPGVAIAQLGGTGAVASVFMRGGESDYVQVLVDGVQVNDPGGSYDWAHLTTDDIERIEVVRGPVSVLYGSDAVAGVVQIFTRGGSTRTRASAQALGGRGERVGAGADGSYGSSDINASISTGYALGSSNDLTLGASASQLRTDGSYAFNNAYRNRTLSAKAALQHGEKADVAFTVRNVDQIFHYPTDGGGNVIDRNQFNDGNSTALGLNALWRFASRLEAVALLTSYRSNTGGENPEDNPGDGFANSTTDVRRSTAEARLNAYLPPALVATIGASADREKGESTFDSDGPFGPFSSATSSERTNKGYFAQVLGAPFERLSVSGGVRLDDNEQFGHFTTARASATLHVVNGVNVRGALGSGFKEPTFLETYATGFAAGNPDLQPEHSRSGEVGVELARSRAHAGATFFNQRFHNLIQYTFNTPTPTSPNYYNVGRARSRGVELTAGATASTRVRGDAQYSYVDTKVEDAGFGQDMSFVQGSRLLRRPTHSASATITFDATRAFTAAGSVIYTGERDDLDFTDPNNFAGSRVVLPSHTTVDASASYRLPMHRSDASVLLRATNLFDARYAEVFNFPAPRRAIWLGASISGTLR